MLIENLSLYLLFTFVTCLTPGAAVLCTINNAFRYGKSCWYISPTGNAFGVLVMSGIAACGLGALIQASPVLYSLIQIGGCIVMIWLGFRCWKAPSVDLSKVATSNNNTPKNKKDIFLSALLLQTTNPMLIVFILSFMPQFISREGSYSVQMSVLISLFIVVCLFVHLFYSYFAASSAKFLKGERFSFVLNKVSGLLFWLISGMMLFNFSKGFSF
jgi:homoserine/homoserine lactone efflux protein